MLRWFLALTVAAVSLSTATAAFTISTVPSMGPMQNAPGGTFAAYLANAQTGLRSGGPAGVVQTPSYFAPIASSVQGGAINNIDVLGPLTGLWDGNTAAGGVFAGQLGNAIYMGLSLKGTGTSLATPSSVSYSGTNYALANTPGFTLAQAVIGGSTQVYGAPTAGATPIQITPGNVTSAYAELYYVGEAYSIQNVFGTDWTNGPQLAAFFTPAGGPSATAPFTVYNTPQGFLSGTWTVNNGVDPISSSIGGTEINGAPAPATLVLMGLGFVGTSLVARVRRRRTV